MSATTSIGVPADSVASVTLDGTTYAYAASDNVVRRVNIATGQERVQLREMEASITPRTGSPRPQQH